VLLTVRYNVPILDVGGRVITSIAYGIEHIMFPLKKGDQATWRPGKLSKAKKLAAHSL
jgi:hypothetical protein